MRHDRFGLGKRGAEIVPFVSLIILLHTLFAANALAQNRPPERVLFISSYSPSFHSFFDQIRGFKTGMKENGFADVDYVLDVEFLDSKRFAYDGRARRLDAELRTKMGHLGGYDLIVTGDDNALKFAIDRLETLFVGANVVFLGVNNIAFARAQDGNPRVVGVVERRSVGATLDVAARLFPSDDGVHIIVDDTRTGRINARQLAAELWARPTMRSRTHSLADLTYDQLFERLAGLPAKTPLYVGSVYRDAAGRSLPFDAFFARLRTVYDGPVFMVQGHAIGHGAFGGRVVSHVEQGRAAAGLAVRILNGTPASELRVVAESPNLDLFDDREIRRFGIDPAALPRGARILNRDPSILDEYSGWVIAGAVIFVLQLGLILLLLYNNRRRREAEREATASQMRLRAFFDNSPSVMFVKDRDHILVDVNDRYLELHHVARDDVVGRRGGSQLGDEARRNAERHDDTVMNSCIASQSPLRVEAKDGRTKHFIVTKFPIFGPDGIVDSIGSINTDVTELRAREAELIVAKAAAEDAAVRSETAAREAIAASRTKSVFLANMSHEIRTPMNAVLGMARALLGTDLSPDQRDFTETIRDSGDALLGILNDILDLSKIEAGKMVLEDMDFAVGDVLESTRALWAPQAAAKGLALEIRNDATDVGMLRTDAGRLRQILYNLVSNAVKFTTAGSVSVSVSPQQRDDDRIGLEFRVTDTGIGISPDAAPGLFDPFTQADETSTRQFGGTGLGLAISRQYAELLGGQIGVDTAPGRGASFWFTIAARRGMAVETDGRGGSENASLWPVPPASSPMKILVAEDNHVNQKVIAALLKPFGHTIDFAANGIEAVQAVRSADYDVVLMDAQMPEMDGAEATREIRRLEDPHKAAIPIIALTANAMAGDRERYLAAGMDGYVSKPIDPALLVAAINETMAEAA